MDVSFRENGRLLISRSLDHI